MFLIEVAMAKTNARRTLSSSPIGVAGSNPVMPVYTMHSNKRPSVMGIEIREASEADYKPIMGMVKELARFERAVDKVKNSVSRMKKEKHLFRALIASENGRPIGYAVFFFAYYTWVGKSLYLDDIYVKPRYRGRKVGTALLKKVFEVAAKEGCKRVRWQVLDWNKDAIKFYSKRGAIIDKSWLNCDFDDMMINKALYE